MWKIVHQKNLELLVILDDKPWDGDKSRLVELQEMLPNVAIAHPRFASPEGEIAR